LRRLIIGPEVQGVFTLFAIAFFLIGITLFGIGLLGEYIGRIYQQVRHRPRYLVEAVLETQEGVKVKKPRALRKTKVAGEADPFILPEASKKVERVEKPEEAAHPSLFSDKQE
jgi:undecaprenyl-phosphate 4-deoxy-4-formamido-L-arabinose transferase